ncbi:tryptophan synthase subunit alpha [Streptomyces sp. NBC_00825]|uniref:tryptophan synthase subunit alpha n=1 Tax=unclassified Streptomyces TaxID=2593676 RepID=UPI002ED484B1|nr:tryptophan synthase subunit alpha [Streptomyces sp. NBC_00826]WTH89274.1 tryptophan synthase subunit alpha [Streptomyces sp. NBC_00825]WTH97999.1 tryptophan synthase subunit alpha [Streptomyces sp. NBC_00822]
MFLPAGLAAPPAERRTIDALSESGADLFEIGVPHRAPVLDGPVITSAYHEALDRGTRVRDVLSTVSHAASRAPVVVMAYWESVARYGPRLFARDMRSAGAAGIMVVDLPDSLAGTWAATLTETGLSCPRLVPPHTSDDALDEVCASASGWLYAPATHHPTGYQGPVDLEDLNRSVRRLRKASALPVVSGIGISTPALARAVAPLVDGVMVGSPIVGALTSAGREAAAALVADFATAVSAPAEDTSHE